MVETLVNFLVDYGYWGMFLMAFLAGSIIPFSSEAVLSGLLVAGASPLQCLIAATLGNVLGGMTCYWFGRMGKMDLLERRFNIKQEKVMLWSEKLRHKGSIFAFFAFVPIIGSVIVVTLGYLRSNPWLVCLFMIMGKFCRYFIWMTAHNYIVG